MAPLYTCVQLEKTAQARMNMNFTVYYLTINQESKSYLINIAYCYIM